MDSFRKTPPPARRSVLCAIDFETTGAVPGFPIEPWQVGTVFVKNGRVDAESAFSSCIRVGDRPFNSRAPGRHRERRSEIASAPTVRDLWPRLLRRLAGRALVAHNAGTERSVLRRMAPLHRFGPWIDTLKLVRNAYPGMRSLALTDVVAALGLRPRVRALCPDLEAHDALYDAFCSAVILEHLLADPAWREVTVNDLA